MRILYTVLHVLKLIVFSDRNQYDPDSAKFNIRFIILFFVLLFLTGANVVLAEYTGHLQQSLSDLKLKHEMCLLKK